MLELHLDPLGGIAGDMFAAALLDLRPELETPLKEALTRCPLIADVSVTLAEHHDGVLKGRRFRVERRSGGQGAGQGHMHSHTDWAQIRTALTASDLDRAAVGHALGIFSRLAEAEARVHGVPVDAVSFHEVGAWDSVTDIVAAAWLIARLGATRWTVGAVPLGGGRVRTEHGLLPVPAPATVLLLQGFETIDDGIGGERVTPTGAAILSYLRAAFSGPPRPRGLSGSAHGFGTKRLSGVSNCLRLLAFETSDGISSESDRVAQLECEIDDQTGEDLAQAIDHLRGHRGVLDVVQAPVFGKKGRVMTHLRVLARPGALDDVLAAMFDETTTIGIRHSIVARSTLPRAAMTIDDDGRVLRAKRTHRPSGVTVKVEADELAAIDGHAARMKTRRLAEAQFPKEADDAGKA